VTAGVGSEGSIAAPTITNPRPPGQRPPLAFFGTLARMPVIFCHGLESSPHGRKYQALLEAGLSPISPDFQGQDLAARVATLLPVLRAHDDAVVVGSSYGGITALCAAIQHVEAGGRIHGLLLCAPALLRFEPPADRMRLYPPAPDDDPPRRADETSSRSSTASTSRASTPTSASSSSTTTTASRPASTAWSWPRGAARLSRLLGPPEHRQQRGQHDQAGQQARADADDHRQAEQHSGRRSRRASAPRSWRSSSTPTAPPRRRSRGSGRRASPPRRAPPRCPARGASGAPRRPCRCRAPAAARRCWRR
jgi:pimeloyl-ACP methyl ester carboxylesterase